MATAGGTGQRLAIHELVNRKCRAYEASMTAGLLYQRWGEEANAGVKATAEQVERDDRTMAEAVDTVRAGMPGGELAEMEGILQGVSQAALVELRTQLRDKKQTRKAAQRRKAEARAVEEAGAAAKEEEHGTELIGEEEEEATAVVSKVDAGAQTLTAAMAAQLQIEEAEPEPEEPEPEEPEPEECAICLNDLPAAGAPGGVLLACSHVFHADCLARWKDKCLEKGLRFTCAMCRGAVVVVAAVAGGAGEGKTET